MQLELSPVKRNVTYYFYLFLFFFLVVLTCWKRNTFKISMKFYLKKRKIIFETLFSPSFDVLHSSPIVYMNHTELIFQDPLLYCTKEVAENHNKLFHFCHGGETHFLVLAQTLIYGSWPLLNSERFQNVYNNFSERSQWSIGFRSIFFVLNPNFHSVSLNN